ncbi:MAG: hypothetical protein AB7O96_08505 [Pseudobdellovibrionaceae bacterium]
MKLIKITVATLLICLLIWGLLRVHGLSRTPSPFEHDFLKRDLQLVAMADSQEQALNSFQEALQIRPDTVIGLHAFLSKDKKFFVAKKQEEIRPFESKTLLEQGKKPLRDVVAEIPTTRLMIWIHDNVNGIHEMFVKELEGLDLDKRLLVHSEFDAVLQSIKPLKPIWIYGTGTGEVTRLISLNSIGLGPIVTMNGDVFIASLRHGKRKLMSESLMSEIRRRGKPVLAVIQDETDLVDAKLWEVDGYITSRPDLALPFLNTILK